ncbi:type II TA system antitoxin MqsA family protein [Syntrophomonas wolfei]|jgi:putative zinc finger/helix-turn-helix YgiT family protein|uniref:type II TA system antitoxin MqsA family protein n=1 Tax=Syntrophomonas wolfei TaxID=863 RepID=UPI000773FCCB|nr:type II TA system antitoxin MqsA family protein [Syntrophomonas wolfei]
MNKVYCYLCDQTNKVAIKKEEEIHTIKGTPVKCKVENAYCRQCGSKVYIPALNDANLDRMDYTYRRHNGIITVQEIEEILRQYNIGAKPLAVILGWGEVTILRYLKGQIPDRAHSNTLLSLKDPYVFFRYFKEKQERLSPVACNKVVSALEGLNAKLAGDELHERSQHLRQAYRRQPDIYNGFVPFNLEKMVQVILFFLKSGDRVYETGMNKLLWYVDMLCYKRSERQALTGLCYKHNIYGPVPLWYDYLYGSLDDVYITLVEDEYGTQIGALADLSADVFSNDELDVLETVANNFKGWSAKKISQYSHRETAYRQTTNGQFISFEYARELSLS